MTALTKRMLKVRSNHALLRCVLRNWVLYLFLLPTLIYFLIFHYGPMYGVVIAFKNFSPVKGILGSPWVGLKHFFRLFNSYQFWPLMKSTLLLGIENLLITFPIPIVFALMLNQVREKKLKKIVQTVTYAPHFISVVVLVSILNIFCSPTNGLINILVRAFGGDTIMFLAEPRWFRTLYIISEVWQNTGWSSIIYLAALTGINVELYEAADMDGASRLRKIWHIDLPGIRETVVVMLIMAVGRFMSLGFEKAFLMQSATNIDASEIIATYVYKVGLVDAQYSFSTAVGLFNNIINIVLIILSNWAAKKATGSGIL